MKTKPTVGIFSFTCCEGCQLELLQLDEKFLQLLQFTKLANSRMLLERNTEQMLDIVIVEGSIVSKSEAEKIKKIRANAKFLIALGACACLGGVNAMRNNLSPEIKKSIEEKTKKIGSEKVCGIGEIVKVDYFLQGCPIVHREVEKVLKLLLSGQKPKQTDYPVCFECKANENPCFLLKNISCLGPIATAGCNAICTTQGFHCTACRGINKDANLAALRECARRRGIPEKEMDDLLGIYNTGGSNNA